MTKDEALKLVLEALHGFIPYLPLNDEAQCGRYDKAITAIKESLAQLEHGWTPERIAGMARLKEAQDKKLAQPEQEPVVCDCDSPSWCKQYKKCNRKMLGFMPYVAQPQRTWVGLTDGEVDKMILLMGFPPDWITENAIVKNIVRNLEAKLKEKNT